MLGRRILSLAVAVHLVCLGAEVTCSEKSAAQFEGPSLSLKLGFSEKTAFLLKSLKLSIAAPNGRTTWQYVVEDQDALVALVKQETVRVENWYATPGQYSLRVSYCLEGSADEVTEAQEFVVTGTELRIAGSLWFIDDKEKHQTFLAHLTIKRFLPGTNGVWLIQDWIPGPKTNPHYQIVNSTNHRIYGVGWSQNFFGHIEWKVNGQWIKYPRGGFCGTVNVGPPVEPNQSVDSVEGYFMGRPTPFVAGRYRYVVQYSDSSATEGHQTELIDQGLTRKRVREIYEVSAEFYIESNQQ